MTHRGLGRGEKFSPDYVDGKEPGIPGKQRHKPAHDQSSQAGVCKGAYTSSQTSEQYYHQGLTRGILIISHLFKQTLFKLCSTYHACYELHCVISCVPISLTKHSTYLNNQQSSMPYVVNTLACRGGTRGSSATGTEFARPLWL